MVSIQENEIENIFYHVPGNTWQSLNVHNMPISIWGNMSWMFEFRIWRELLISLELWIETLQIVCTAIGLNFLKHFGQKLFRFPFFKTLTLV